MRNSASRWALGLALAAALLWLGQYALRAAPIAARAPSAAYDVLAPFRDDAPVRTRQDWIERRAPLLRAAFQEEVYGPLPAPAPARFESRTLIDPAAFAGAARLEQAIMRFDVGGRTFRLHALIATPTLGPALNAPTLLAPNFCGNAAALGGRYEAVSAPAWTPPRCRTFWSRQTTRLLHGANIIRLPIERLTRAGYAVITFFPGEITPDDRTLAPEALRRLDQTHAPRLGAIAAWAWTFSRVVDAARADARFDGARIALFGHSRYGKAALLAAALDERIALVIANQTGRLGAALTAGARGETIAALRARFPYWLPTPARMHGDLDQHQLLALMAPRPVLLGGARMDAWSDPAGAFRAAEAASPAYALFGAVGLNQRTMSDTNLNADIAAYVRAGGHGVRPIDWRMTIAFLDAHLRAGGGR